jgi:transposase InsO family protein
MFAFIDDHRGAYGVEPICKVLPIAPSTYHAHVARRLDPSKCSARALRDEVLRPEIERVFAENFKVYGARKVWRQMMREGFDVARCTVERLMQGMGLAGVIRGKSVRTTISDKSAPCPLGRYVAGHVDDADRRRKAMTALTAKMARVAHAIVKTGTEYRPFLEPSDARWKDPSLQVP